MRRVMTRTVEAAQDYLAEILGTITPNECANYLKKRWICVNLNAKRSKVRGALRKTMTYLQNDLQIFIENKR